MTVPEKHQLNVARKVMRNTCAGARILGPYGHQRAREIIESLTGKVVSLSMDCDCHMYDLRS